MGLIRFRVCAIRLTIASYLTKHLFLSARVALTYVVLVLRNFVWPLNVINLFSHVCPSVAYSQPSGGKNKCVEVHGKSTLRCAKKKRGKLGCQIKVACMQ